jgi:hypothetical protein
VLLGTPLRAGVPRNVPAALRPLPPLPHPLHGNTGSRELYS